MQNMDEQEEQEENKAQGETSGRVKRTPLGHQDQKYQLNGEKIIKGKEESVLDNQGKEQPWEGTKVLHAMRLESLRLEAETARNRHPHT